MDALMEVDSSGRIAIIRQMRNHGNYDQEFKKKVIITAEKTSNREAEKIFGISESNIRRWRKLKGEIFGFGPSALEKRKKKKLQIRGRLLKKDAEGGFANIIIEELKGQQDSPSNSNSGSGIYYIFKHYT